LGIPDTGRGGRRQRVAAGDTTPQVASQLHVSPSTVKTHLDHIYAKLGINSRPQLAAEFARRSG
jgi:DNA-binding CsgD family transcriptional regulator